MARVENISLRPMTLMGAGGVYAAADQDTLMEKNGVWEGRQRVAAMQVDNNGSNDIDGVALERSCDGDKEAGVNLGQQRDQLAPPLVLDEVR